MAKETVPTLVTGGKVPVASVAMIVNGENWTNIKDLAKEILKSGWFKGLSEAGCVMIAIVMIKEGLDPIEFMARYHVIDGIPRKKPNFMLGQFSQAGGNYNIIQDDDNACEIEFSFKERKGKVRVTIEQMAKAGIIYGKDGSVKANWDRFTDDMLFARCVGKGLRRYAAELVGGEYTDGEALDFADQDQHQNKPAINGEEIAQRIASMKVEQPRQEEKSEEVKQEPVKVEEPAEQAKVSNEQCPIKGKYFGKNFADMELDVLVYLLDKETQDKHPELTAEHIIAVERVIEAKENEANER